jgi:hypothetical protein
VNAARLRIHGVVDNDIHPPLFGSTQRSFGLFRGLARAHEVDVLCMVPWRNAAAREEAAAGVRLHRRRAWYTTAAWRLETLGLAPLFLSAHGHASRAARLLGVLPGTPDVLLAGAFFGGLLERSAARLKVYASHNVEYDHFLMTAPRLLGGARWAAGIRELERGVVEAVDLVVACSDEDATRMRALYGVPADGVVVAPNGFDETAIRPPRPGEREAARAVLGLEPKHHVGLFLGSDAPPNREALRILMDEVMPSLAGEDMRLLVVGDIAQRATGRGEPWLITRRAMANVLPFLHAADVGLNPVVAGGGSNVKVPTYLAAGLAVLTTSFGLRGYASLAPSVIQADTADFADTWRSRPAGWHARREAPPAALAAFAWGSIGESLGGTLVERLRTRSHEWAGNAHGPDAARRKAGA